MGKAKNRNAQRIANGQKPKLNVSGKSHKPFIGNAVFTMEDDRIMRDIIEQYPDTWTLAQIKDALPYSHTFKNITNYLQRLVSSDVIAQHTNMSPDVIAQHTNMSPDVVVEETPPTTPLEDYFTTPESYNVCTVLETLQRYFPQLGEKYEDWPALIKTKTGRQMTRSQIIRAARQAQLAYAPADWTQAENDLLRSETESFVSVQLEPTYIHDVFDFPRTHQQVLDQIVNLNRLDKMMNDNMKDAQQTTEETPADMSDMLPEPKPIVTEPAPKKERKETTMANTKTTPAPTPAQTAEQKNKDDFIALSNILMNLTPDTEVHVNIKFPNGLVVNFEKGATNA